MVSVIIQLSQNIMMISKLVVGKMKDETAGVTIEKSVGLKQRMYLLLIDDGSENKKTKGVNKIVVATKIHYKYKDIFLNNKCLRHLMNRI